MEALASIVDSPDMEVTSRTIRISKHGLSCLEKALVHYMTDRSAVVTAATSRAKTKRNEINNAARDLEIKQEKYSRAPPVLRCASPVIVDSEGNELSMELRHTLGEDDSYYLAVQFERFLGYADIKHSILASARYEKHIHYEYLLLEGGDKELFLTFFGLLTMMNFSQKPNVQQLLRTVQRVVNAAIFEGPRKMADIHYALEDDEQVVTITERQGHYAGCYALDIGSVNEVFDPSTGILIKPKPFGHHGYERVYKMGKSNDVERRMCEHKKMYRIDGVEQAFKYGYAINEKLCDMTYSLENRLFDFVQCTTCNHSSYRSTVLPTQTEIFVVSAAAFASINKGMTSLTEKGMPPATKGEIASRDEHNQRMLTIKTDRIKGYALSIVRISATLFRLFAEPSHSEPCSGERPDAR